ncbi:hypothetical protein TVAG_434620 [Trichomonas vaginalis G3]|uniref:Uncharacterized protein n=1 Tax=Trichomonas vaginalis (strain ATCC PRA-98 / G3) TaxID=412133 RepID=A2DSP5_TRIV3|nr:proteasome regulatory particle assembly [Trichomonas vaginalis G3]EAY16625.1 hypothetical protein TVAG_434620 [Trichomonas vaginalis G3]KAI5533002.1 proteasome regulatory particle assembly [Trichomonas vaginalis G3]|eukprot:XP_001328848.1 hypothetical protein [Trichomonas vaginalis G3]
MVEILISNGAETTINDSDHGFSLLHVATIVKNRKIIDILIKYGVRVNDNSNKFGLTPLLLASLLNYKEIVQYLISRGAEVDTTDKYGNNAIAYALLYNNKEFMETALNRFHQEIDSINYKTFDLERNNKDLIKLLISYHVNIRGQNTHGNSLLHIAALMSNPKNAEILISQGVEVNSFNKFDQTPLDMAVMRYKRDHNQDSLDSDQEDNKEFVDFDKEDFLDSGTRNSKDFLDLLEKKSEMVALLRLNGGISNSNREIKNKDITHMMFDYFWDRRNRPKFQFWNFFILINITLYVGRQIQAFTNNFMKLLLKAFRLILVGVGVIYILRYAIRVYLSYYEHSLFWD